MTSSSCQIIRRRNDESVEASLLEGMIPQDLVILESEWAPERSLIYEKLLQSSVPRSQWPQSLHWDWSNKAPQLKLLVSTGFGITCENRWQGVILTKTSPYQSRLEPDKGKPLVYIDHLESAPWNWPIPDIDQKGEFRGIGSLLVWRAVKQSEEEGFRGRIGLHALSQSVQFYEKSCGMTSLGPDASKQDLIYFELSGKNVKEYMNGRDRS